MAKKRKLSLEEAAAKLAAIAEKALAKLPEKERDARVEAFARRDFTGVCGTLAKSSKFSCSTVTGSWSRSLTNIMGSGEFSRCGARAPNPSWEGVRDCSIVQRRALAMSVQKTETSSPLLPN